MASGPIQYEEYLNYSKNFEKRWCLDLSTDALKMAEKKIGEHGVFLYGSFFNLPFEENFFDCAISLHTIYHVAKEKQEEAVRKLIRITKLGQPISIIYSNPDVFWNSSIFRRMGLLKGERRTHIDKNSKVRQNTLYFDPHPLSWWNRFTDEAELKKYLGAPLDLQHKKNLFPIICLEKKCWASYSVLRGCFQNSL